MNGVRRHTAGSVPGRLLAHAVASLAAAAAFLLALAAGAANRSTVLPGVVALACTLLAVVWPSSTFGTLALVAFGAQYLFATASVHETSGPPGLVLAFAAALYLLHSALALAAALRDGGDTEPLVLARWAERTGTVLAGALPLSLLVLGLGSIGEAPLGWRVLAVAAAVAVIGLPALLLARSDRQG
jgi:hypothetical protein